MTDIMCDTCGDSGRVEWMIEGDPNVYQDVDSDGTILCPDCVCKSGIWAGLNQRVALWCTTHNEFLGNPESVQETNKLWVDHTGKVECCPYDCGHCHDGCGCPQDRNPVQ